jgi:hypothetical protein
MILQISASFSPSILPPSFPQHKPHHRIGIGRRFFFFLVCGCRQPVDDVDEDDAIGPY